MFHEIGWHDLEFTRVPVGFRSERGVPQPRWIPVGMPYIPQNVINGVFYLYKDADDARAGRNPGGTGFMVRYDGSTNELWHDSQHFYGVTNWHVACAGGFSVIRVNTKDGGTDILEFGPEDWQFLPGKQDVAVVPLVLDERIHNVSFSSTQRFLFESPQFNHGHVGVGDDVFMLGLFVDHDGVSVNVPSARFGNISMLPNPRALIEQPTGYKGESFVIDMHSRSGFSGSPVYVYRTVGSDLTNDFFGHDVEVTRISQNHRDGFHANLKLPQSFFRFLGMHWGQFPERWELKDKKKMLESRKDLIVDGGYVEGMSGMTCVIPAWNIFEVLNMPKLQALRQPELTAAIEKANRANKPIAESAAKIVPEPSASNPVHREDFTSLLGAAVKGKPQADQT